MLHVPVLTRVLLGLRGHHATQDDQHGHEQGRHKVRQRLGEPERDDAEENARASLLELVIAIRVQQRRQQQDGARDQHRGHHTPNTRCRGDRSLRGALLATLRLHAEHRLGIGAQLFERHHPVLDLPQPGVEGLGGQPLQNLWLPWRASDQLVELLHNLADTLVVHENERAQPGARAVRTCHQLLIDCALRRVVRLRCGAGFVHAECILLQQYLHVLPDLIVLLFDVCIHSDHIGVENLVEGVLYLRQLRGAHGHQGHPSGIVTRCP